MAGFAREPQGLVLYLEVPEADLLAHTTEQFIALLAHGRSAEPGANQGGPDDPFARWEREFGHEDVQEPDNPVLERLFPSPYEHDPEASMEFHRFTEPAQRTAKLEAAQVVLADLERLNNGMVPVADEHRTAWMKTLNNIRLTLSVVLDITDETSHDLAARHPEDDPRGWMYQIYNWLAWLLETLLDTMTSPGDSAP